MRDKMELFGVVVLILGLSLFTGKLAYDLGKWVAHYNDSWMHLGANQ